LAAAILKIEPAAWRARIAAVLSVDVTARLSGISIPVLYLRATADRVVPRSASELVGRLLPSAKVVDLDAPHFMLQAKPVESAAHIRTFAREVGFAF
jgi:pimeloyl-ACP methyl ester carboxylesterase